MTMIPMQIIGYSQGQCCCLCEHDEEHAYGFRVRAMTASFVGTSNVNWLLEALNSLENSVSRA